jgi:hypothetical protein
MRYPATDALSSNRRIIPLQLVLVVRGTQDKHDHRIKPDVIQ